MLELQLRGEFIELDKLLKAMGLADSGGQARALITAGEVRGTGSRYELKTDEQTTQGAVGSGGRVDVNVPAGENGDTVTPSIRICNDQKGCSAWVNGPNSTNDRLR